MKVWSLQSQNEVHTFRGHKDWVTSVAFSPNGHLVVSGSVDQSVKLWELSGQEVALMTFGHLRQVDAVAFSPDGRLLASGAADHTVKLWDVATAAELYTLRGHLEAVTAVHFTSDGKRLVSASRDQSIKIWDTTSGKEIQTIGEPSTSGSRGMYAMTVTPDGKQLVVWVSSRDRPPEIHVYEIESGAELKVIQPQDRTIVCLAFSADGELAAVGDGSGGVRIWNVAKNERVKGDLVAHRRLGDLILTPDKKLLITGGDDGELVAGPGDRFGRI